MARQHGELLLVVRIAIPVHEHDRTGADTVGVRGGQFALRARKVDRLHAVALCADPLIDLDHAIVDALRQNDMTHKKLRPVLVGNTQCVAEPAGDCEHRALALAFEQGVGGNGGSHLDGFHSGRRNGRVRCEAEQFAHAMNGRIWVALGILREQLMCGQRPVGATGDDVGERPAAVDPELPAAGWRVCHDLWESGTRARDARGRPACCRIIAGRSVPAVLLLRS